MTCVNNIIKIIIKKSFIFCFNNNIHKAPFLTIAKTLREDLLTVKTVKEFITPAAQ